jgi:hypothetical protein
MLRSRSTLAPWVWSKFAARTIRKAATPWCFWLRPDKRTLPSWSYATCERLRAAGVTINRPPRDGRMAFVRSPDLISIELLQRDGALAPREPWLSMPNTGSW